MRVRLLRILIVALIAAGVLIPAELILTQQRASAAAVILTTLDGTTDVARGAGDFARATDGQVLSAGDRVRTGDQSHAVVTFFDGSTVQLEPATTLTVVRATPTPTGAITIQLEQAIGRTWSSVQRLLRSESKFELRTPTTTATVRGTGFVTDVLAGGATTVMTTDGIVEVGAQGQTVVVPAGEFTTVQPGASPARPERRPMPRNMLRFGLHSPARLVVVDPVGRACGIVPAGPTLVRQIPGCLATEPGIDPQLVDLPSAAAGTYSIVIESIAPGGDFVATASAVDSAGNLSFNYSLSGGGKAGTRFASTLQVDSGPDGALFARGLGRLVLADRPTRVVVFAASPRPAAVGTPKASLFPLLPRFGYTAGFEVTALALAPTQPGAAPSLTPPPTPTEVVVAPEPTEPPIFTRPPAPALPPVPISTPAPTPTPAAPPPAPTPTPQPIPSGPTLTGGLAFPGRPMAVSGGGWSTALIRITWEDGTIMAQANADASGNFTARVTVPFGTRVGATYRLTASDGRQTATAQVGVYAPTIAVTCSRTTGPVSVTGRGWPPSGGYAIRSSLLAASLSGTVSADGTFSASFMPPSGVLPGDYQVTASVGTLFADPQTCTLR